MQPPSQIYIVFPIVQPNVEKFIFFCKGYPVTWRVGVFSDHRYSKDDPFSKNS